MQEVHVHCVSAAHIRTLNHQFRAKDKPTNVLSFSQPQQFCQHEGYPQFLGDIVLSPDIILQEAMQQSIPVKNHFTHLLVHGLLHLLGYDHENEDDFNTMSALEIKLLASLHIANPYE